ncbi:MAG: hypothetical protein WCI41_01355 [bacterium]
MTKKITYSFFAIIFIFILSTSFVSAQNYSIDDSFSASNAISSFSNTTPNQNVQQQKNTDIQNTKDEIKSIRETAKQKMSDLKVKMQLLKDKNKLKIQQDTIAKREQILEKIDNAIMKVDGLKDKVAAEVLKLGLKGVVIPDSTKDLSSQAESKLTQANGNVAEINTILSNSTSELSKDDKITVASLISDTQALIKDSQQALNDEISILKQALAEKTQKDIQ